MGVPYFGVLLIRILLFRVLYQSPLFAETPMWRSEGLEASFKGSLEGCRRDPSGFRALGLGFGGQASCKAVVQGLYD